LPNPASSIILEFFEINNAFYVKVFYKDSINGEDEVFEFPGIKDKLVDGSISINSFQRFIKSKLFFYNSKFGNNISGNLQAKCNQTYIKKSFFG
jgi:hypothetical protein